jgi:hypothetical protein
MRPRCRCSRTAADAAACMHAGASMPGWRAVHVSIAAMPALRHASSRKRHGDDLRVCLGHSTARTMHLPQNSRGAAGTPTAGRF